MTNRERDSSNLSSETEQSETIPSTTEAVASSSANNVYANSNLEVAMSEFISRIVTPHAATIPQILRAVGSEAERIYNVNISKPKQSSGPSVVTVVHQLHDDDIASLREENQKLRDENHRLSAENVHLKQLLQNSMSQSMDTMDFTTSTVTTPPTDHSNTQPHSVMDFTSTVTTPPTDHSNTQPHSVMDFTSTVTTPPTEHSNTQPHSVRDFTSTVTTPPTDHSNTRPHSVVDFATKDAVKDFNRLPRDLSQFVGQMKNGTEHFPKFEDLSDDYKKNSKTKSAFSKRKAVYQYMLNYEGGLEKCLSDFAFVTPTWLYNNKVRNSRT